MTDNPIAVQGIDHVVIRARNVAKILEFYCDVLNCPLERQLDDIGLYQLRAGSALIDIVDAAGELGRKAGRPPDPATRNMDHLCIAVEPWDAAAIAAYLQSHGIEPGPTVTRYGARGNGPSIYICDPEGNTVGLKGPPENSD